MAKEENLQGKPGIGPSDAEVRQAHSDAIHKSTGAVRYGARDGAPASAHVAATPLNAAPRIGMGMKAQVKTDF